MKPFLLVFILAIAFNANAADRFWIGSGTYNFNDPLAWGGTAPGVNDRVFFTGGGVCNLTANATVAHFEFQGTFSGTFNQNTSSLTVAPGAVIGATGMIIGGTGTFFGGNKNITTTNFTINGATFNSTSGMLTTQGNYSFTSGTFYHNFGWVRMKGVGTSFTITGNTTFNKLELQSISDFDQMDMDTATDLIVLDTLLKSGLRNNLNNGDVFLKGDLVITYLGATGGCCPYGNARIHLDGTGDQRIVGKAPTFTSNILENIYIDKPSGTLYLFNWFSVGPDWRYIRGLIDPGTSTVLFMGDGTTSGSHRWNNVAFTSLAQPWKRIIPITDTLIVSGRLEFWGVNRQDVYTGTICAEGDIVVLDFSSAAAATDCGGTAKIVINGTGDQLFDGQTTRTRGFLPNIIIDKPSGTLFLKDTIVVERDWTYIRGNVDATTYNSYVNFIRNTPQYIDGEGSTGTTMLFNKIGIQNNVYLTPINRILLGDVRVKYSVDLENHLLTLNGNDLFIENASNVSIQRTTGKIISETTPGNPDISRIHWFIDNAAPGTSYIFPFGTTTTYIPDTLIIQTSGIPSGTGSVSLATYPTVTTANPNNRPLPPGVTNLNSFIGNENSTRILDRYWVYECYNYTTTPTVSLHLRYLDSEWNTGNNSITETLLRPMQWNSGTSVWDPPNGTGTINITNNVATVSNVTSCSAFTLIDPTFPNLVFFADDTTICVGDTVHFADAYSSPPTSRSWFFPGGTPSTSTDSTPVIVYNTVGNYNVVLWATYPGGQLKDTLFNYISVGAAMNVSSTPTNILCNGDTTGSIDITVSGGSGTFDYLWDNGDTIDDRTALLAGTYTVTVSDVAGCSKIESNTITEPAALSVSISNITSTLCSASCNGSAKANPTGGTGTTYEYDWDNSETTQTAVALCPGLHIVTVTDDNGCIDTASVTITGSPAFSATIISTTPTSCSSNCDGAAIVTPTGGTGTPTYVWSCTAQTTASVTLLCAGVCTVTATDGNGCTASATDTINATAAIMLTLRDYDISCNGLTDGSAKVIGSGGTGILTYAWSGGTVVFPGDSVRSLPTGTITVTATDANTCTTSASGTISQPSAIALTINKSDVSCNSGSNGSAWVSATGGTGTKTYSWSRGTNPTNDTVINLNAGGITVTVTDLNGCSTNADTTIVEPAVMSLAIAKSDVDCFGGNNGNASVSVTGGTGIKTYQWDRGTNPTNDTVTNLTAGLVTVVVTDANGCRDTASITINQPTTGIILVMHKTNITCNGLTDGRAGVDATGGTVPYGYVWSSPGGGVQLFPDSFILLSPGIASVTVTDDNGCSVVGSTTIVEPPVFDVTLTKWDISCNGVNDGRVKANVSGGTPLYVGPFWNPSNVGTHVGNDSINSLPPGQICILYFDANSCQDTACATIIEPAPIVLTMDSVGVSCNGGSDGKAYVTASGGLGAGTFTYLWDRGANPLNRDSVIGLAPGAVSVEVTSGGCTEVGTTTITQPAAMVLTLDKRDLTCNGSNDGIAWASVSGGNAPYIYLWSDGNPTISGDSTTNLSAILVSVTVTDSTGCTVTGSITIGEPSEISIAESVTSVTCPAGNDGAINITATGGAGVYTYLWSDGSINQNIAGLAEGFYSVIVTDTSGCTGTKSFTLQVGTRFEVTASVVNASCGNNDGVIDVTVLGGTGPFIYSWNDGPNTNQDRTTISAGLYTVSVTDQSSTCQQSIDILVEDAGGPTVSATIVDATDCSSNDGTIVLAVIGGSGFYSYNWSHGPVTANVSGLAFGDYTVTVTDDTAGCISVSTFTVGVLNGIALSGVVADATCGANDGGINLTVSSGTAAFNYTWSNGAITEDISNLGAGTYAVTVTDAGNCTGDKIFTVSEGGATVSGNVVNVSCFGEENGSITLTVVGTNVFSWSNGEVTPNITSLKPGTYTVTVNDTSTQCSTIKDFSVTEPLPFTLTADRSNISCNGLSDGWIDLIVNGGMPGFTYSWTGPSFTAATEDISSLAAGTYDVTVTDMNNCTSNLSVTLTESTPLVLTLDTQRISCGGEADGSAWVVVTGGVPPFTYDWSDGDPVATGDTVENLETGIVSVTVTDANGCSATDSILVPEPTPLTLTISKTDILCFGNNNGTATATPGGGTPGYTYLWNRGTGTTNPTVTALAPGFVTVVITDLNLCSITDSIEIIEPDSITTVVTATDVSCFGGNNGTATVVATGGTQVYTYLWSRGTNITSATVTGLSAGGVTVTVTDTNNCVKIDTVTISEPATPVSTTITHTNVSCFGNSNGTATVVASGGTPGYTYNWSIGSPVDSSSVSGLPAGNAIVTVTDINGCEVRDTATILQPTEITLVTSKTDISCFGANDGIARVTSATGGTPGTLVPYTYFWTGGGVAPFDLDSLTGISAVTVTVEVRDSLNCLQTADVTIVEPDSIGLSIGKVDISCYGLTDGEATVTPSGGNGGFTYVWTDGTPLTGSPSVTGLPAGTVTVTVTDSNNCFDTISTTIVEPDSLLLTIASTNVSCFGGNNGTAIVTASGGTPGTSGYIYDWSSGVPGDTDAVTQLDSGIVIVTVTDSRGCFDTISANITQPLTAVSTTISKTDVSCFGGNDGTATVVASGGTPGYAYVWSDGNPLTGSPNVTGLISGTVIVTVTDTNSCVISDTVTIIEPPDLVLTIAVDSNASCQGGADGGLTVSLTGGTSTYSYVWSDGQQLLSTALTSHTISGLTVGNYTVVVTDANNCVKQISEDIIERPGPQIGTHGIVLDRPTCDRNDGSICITATTTDMPLTFTWNPILSGNCPTGLAEGAYSVTITDGANCSVVIDTVLSDIPGPAVDFVKIKDSYCDDNNGQATAIVTGGVPTYDFTWIRLPNTIISNDSIIDSLVAGLYSLIVADANVCDTQINFEIFNIASPNAAIAPVSPQTVFEGQPVDLVATSDISTSVFNWTPATGLSCDTCSSTTATPRTTITYELIVVDASTQCSDTAYMTIIVKDEKNIFVPNVITPNGDGVNDVWRITELQEIFLDNELVILNRWGDEIFRERSYQNKFDGTYKGNKLPDGTYYYLIQLKDIGKTISGPLTIISE